MVMGIVLARLLMPEDFGRFAYISAVVTALMIPFGVTVTPLLVTDGGRNPSLFGKVLGFMCITSALKLAVLFLYISYLLASHQLSQALLAFLIGLPVAIFDLPETLRADLEGRGRFEPNLAVQLANLATHAAVSIGLVLLGWGVYGLALGGFAAYWPQLLLYLKSGGRRFAEARFKQTDLVALGRSGLAFWTSQFSTNMAARVDKIFLGKVGGDTELGFYNRALNFAPFSMFILSSFLTNASVVAMRQTSAMKQKLAIVWKTSVLLFSGALANWAILWWFSDPIVPWLFGGQWADAVPAFQAFSWLGFALALQYVPMNFLTANEAYSYVAAGKATGLLSISCILAILWAIGDVSAVTVAQAICIGMASAGAVMTAMSLVIILRTVDNHE
jgi:O-antigen/teichoic acid export membrane protein